MAWQDDVLKIALANPDVIVPPEALNGGKAKKNKFNAVKCEWLGIKFDSKKEMARFGQLRLLELTGQITGLQLQPVFVLTAGVKYKADFRYTEDGKTVVEEIKGGKATQTRVFLNKWKQAKFLYPEIDFRLIER